MSKVPEPYDLHDPLDHKSRRSQIRRSRALRTETDHRADPVYNIACSVVVLGGFAAFGFLYWLTTVSPALTGFTPLALIVGIVAAVIVVTLRHQLLSLWRNITKTDSRAERARRHHEEKMLHADQKLAEREFTIGADGEMVFLEKPKDQSSTSEN